jgi:glycosyltransferase involved in cell wall biosynthesis
MDVGDKKISITIAICTLNRAQFLHRTLDSLSRVRVPDNLDWEVVVVNNDCTDDTDQVIDAFVERLPIRREFEPERGLSRARNRAVDAARGDYIIWTDDDVTVDPLWLAGYLEAFEKWPEAAVFGGKILERFEPPVSKWLVENQAFQGFGARDFGDDPLPLSIREHRLPFGPNFAVRAAEQKKFRYNVQLGHAPGQLRRNEETDVVERILNSGAIGYWVPRASVEHGTSREQQTLKYFADFFSTYGEAEEFRKPSVVEGPLWWGAPRWMWRRLIEKWLRYRMYRLISPASVWLPHLRERAIVWGKIRYWRNERL